MKASALIAAVLLSATSVLAHAEDPQDHEAHHPNAASQPAPQSQAPASVMGQGGTMAQGMMGSNNSMMGMMGAGMPMMGMGQASACSGGSCGMGGMATIDHVEGRIAYLKAELKITEAQNDVWNVFADALRNNAGKLGELRASIPSQGSLADRLSWQEKWLATRAENTRAIRTAYAELAAKLDDDQKKSAEQLLAPHIGMMAMMSGMGAGQMMGGTGMGQMGNMGMGQMPMMPGSSMTTGRMGPGK